MSKKKIVKIDIDGVLRDTANQVLQIYKEHYDPECNVQYKDLDQFYIAEKLPLLKGDMHGFFRKYARELVLEARMYHTKIPQVMKELQEKYHVMLCSHQKTNEDKKFTKEWLKHQAIPYDSLKFAWQKQTHESDIIIDDHPKNLVRDHSPLRICINHPWNQEWQGSRAKDFLHASQLLQTGEPQLNLFDTLPARVYPRYKN